ncbi:MAG: glycosyltransferase family 2 protein, partial [Muribaculaceae bacterium]|nr:glycosyltransferase family 2 protein [Muribaculaceae bacterium]
SYNMYSQYWKNPKGFSFFRKTEMVCAPTLRRRFVSCVHYVATSIIAGNSRFIQESPRKALTLFACPAGFLWYLQIRRKVKAKAKMNFR